MWGVLCWQVRVVALGPKGIPITFYKGGRWQQYLRRVRMGTALMASFTSGVCMPTQPCFRAMSKRPALCDARRRGVRVQTYIYMIGSFDLHARRMRPITVDSDVGPHRHTPPCQNDPIERCASRPVRAFSRPRTPYTVP